MANHIESVSCSVQTIDSLFSSISDTPAISKAITRTSRQRHLTHLELELPVLEAVRKLDESGHPEIDTGPVEDQLNQKHMTKQDWVEAQSKDKTIGEIIHLFKTKELYGRKVSETVNNEMRHFTTQ